MRIKIRAKKPGERKRRAVSFGEIEYCPSAVVQRTARQKMIECGECRG